MRVTKLIAFLGLISLISWTECAVAKNKTTAVISKKKLQVVPGVSAPQPSHYSHNLGGITKQQQQQQQNNVQDYSPPTSSYMVSYNIPGMSNHVTSVGNQGEMVSETSYVVVSEDEKGYGAPIAMSSDFVAPKLTYGGGIEDIYGPSGKNTFGSASTDYGPPLKETYGPSMQETYGQSLKDSFGPPLRESFGPSLKDSYGPPLKDSYGPPKTSYGPPKNNAPFGHGGYKTNKGPPGPPSHKFKFHIPSPEINNGHGGYADSDHEASNTKGTGLGSMAGLGGLAGAFGLKALIPVLALVPIIASIAVVFLPLPWLYFPPGVLHPSNGVIKLGRSTGRNGIAWDFNPEKFFKTLGQAEKFVTKTFEKIVDGGREFGNGKNECLERVSCEIYQMARVYSADKLLDTALRQILPLSSEKASISGKNETTSGCLTFACKPFFKGND